MVFKQWKSAIDKVRKIWYREYGAEMYNYLKIYLIIILALFWLMPLGAQADSRGADERDAFDDWYTLIIGCTW